METLDTEEKIFHHVLDSDLNRIPFEHAFKSYFIGLFFTASWCPPCESFANELHQVYQEANSKEKIFEVIQISNEKTEKDLETHIKEDRRDWFYVQCNDHLMYELIDEYDVKFLPVLIIINKEKVVLSKTGRLDVKELGKKAYEKWYNAYREEKNKDKEIINENEIL